MQANKVIRSTAKCKGIKLWQIAQKIGVSESTMTRWLRMPLSTKREAAISKAIEELAKEEFNA